MLDGFIEAFETGYEYVNGNRFKGGLLKGAMPFSHKIGVRVLSYIAAKKYKTPWKSALKNTYGRRLSPPAHI